MRATGGQILRCIVLVISALATGCRSNFYLSESEVAAYSGNLRSAASSVDLLDNLPDLPLTVEFDPMSPTPQIRRTNLLEVLRGLPELFFLEVFFRQIHLERGASRPISGRSNARAAREPR